MPYVTSWERLGEKRGEERGVKIGEERGEKKAKIETAGKLLENGVDINIIVNATGLPKEEIEKLAETIH